MSRSIPVVLILAGALAFGTLSHPADKPALVGNATKDTPALSPEQGLRSLLPRPGFRVEQMAAEPLVMDPIAFDWAPDGRLWVVEMADYPLGLDDHGKPGGRIRILEDTRGTGKYDKSTLFLDNIPFPSDIMAWGKGVLVTAAPDVFYAEDSDGDGKADVRRVLFTGFNEGNQQHRVNGLRWGLDNWIYLANGDSNGKVRSLKTGKIVDIAGRDIRIRPDTGEVDVETGMAQYGRNRDDWGNWFGCNNSHPLYYYVLPDRYLRRNPHVTPPPARLELAPNQAIFPRAPVVSHWKGYRPPAPGQPNLFTSACSAMVYRDDLFGPDYENNVFISEPVHNLIHRQVLKPDGVSFTSRRAADEPDREFLASTDCWFRPATVRTGPDGALWVADMYRFVIEHPQWIDADILKALDLRAGHDKGRIYRIFPENKQPRPIPNLTRLDTAGLVAALDSPSGWQRDTIQRLLIEKGDRQAVQPLTQLAAHSPRSLARLHALCTLDGMNALAPEVVTWALGDAHPGVRRHAVRLAEMRLEQAPQLLNSLLRLCEDPDAPVRLQLAFTLGYSRDPRAGRALADLAARHPRDTYLNAAIASSLNAANLPSVLAAVVESVRQGNKPSPLTGSLVQTALGLGEPATLAGLLDQVSRPEKDRFAPWQMTTLATILDSLQRHRGERDKLLGPEVRQRLARLQDQARSSAPNDQAPLEERLASLTLLGRDATHQAADLEILIGLLGPRHPLELQSAAVTELGRLDVKRISPSLLTAWTTLTPQVRSQVLDLLLSREAGIDVLLTAVETKRLSTNQLDAARRDRLLNHKRPDIRDRARKFLSAASSTTRQQVLSQYQQALRLTGDVSRGKGIFAQRCSACHQLEGVGHKVGADLAGSRDKSPQALLTAILDPNQAVEARYNSYVAVTQDGRSFTGVLTAETSTAVTLVGPEGKEQVLLRRDLEELQNTGKSFMPEGLEQEIPVQAMADLLAYLAAATTPGPRK